MLTKFRTPSRTVVTEMKAFVVDSTSRTGVFRQTVSARVQNEQILETKDINVSASHAYRTEDIHSVVGLHCPEPVRIILTQDVPTDAPEEPDPTPPPPMFEVPESIHAGLPITVILRDGHVAPMGSVPVTCMNLQTGETEALTLHAETPGVFVSQLNTRMTVVPGVDFDGRMHVVNGQSVLFQYQSGAVEASSRITSEFAEGKLTVPQTVFLDNALPIQVEDSDVTSDSLTVRVFNPRTDQTIHTLLYRIEDGVFSAVMDTTTELTRPHLMLVQSGDILTVTYASEHFVNLPEVVKTVHISEERPVSVSLKLEGALTPNSPAFIELDDYNKRNAGNITLFVTNLRTRAFVQVTCSELLPSSGLFRGTFDIVSSGTAGLVALPSDTIQVNYVDTSGEEPESVLVFGNVVAETERLVATPFLFSSASSTETEAKPENKVELIVNGMFYLNGSFTGRLEVQGLHTEFTRCSIIHA